MEGYCEVLTQKQNHENDSIGGPKNKGRQSGGLNSLKTLTSYTNRLTFSTIIDEMALTIHRTFLSNFVFEGKNI